MKCSCSGSVPSFTQGTDTALRGIYTGTVPVLMTGQMPAFYFEGSKAKSNMIPPKEGVRKAIFTNQHQILAGSAQTDPHTPPRGSLQMGLVLYAKLTRIAMSRQQSMLAADLPSAHTPSDSDTSGQTPWPA